MLLSRGILFLLPKILGDGPAGLIAELVLANDVADYVRFRAVCQPWRRCSPDPRVCGLDDRFLPRRWIMLDKAISASTRCHRFLNISTGESIRMDLPELDDHRCLALTPEGLILLLHEPTLVVRLLNPLTRQLIDLPPVTTLLTEDERAMLSMGEMSLEVYGIGLVDDASSMAVAVYFSDPRVLVVAKPGDDAWAVVYNGTLYSTVSSAGRFYCCIGIDVMMLDMDQQPRLLMAAENSNSIRFSQMAHSVHLVDNAGELMLVHRLTCHDSQNNHKRKYEVYKVDLDAGALVPAKSFDGRAVFMGRYRTISVAAEAFPSIAADTLYLGCDFAERTSTGRYNLIDRSSRPIDDDSSVEMPCSIIHCLSQCIWGMGNFNGQEHPQCNDA
nr:unnamed protein product [Digitaria exilis]